MKQQLFNIFFPITLLLAFLTGCKTEVKRESFDTVIQASIYDDKGAKVDGAVVAVFDNYNTYKSSLKSKVTDGAIRVDTSAGGEILFEKLSPATKYWISAYYIDSTIRIPGAKIGLDNIDINNELALELRKGSVNFIDVKMIPGEGTITFWIGGSDNSRLPLSVIFNNQQVGNITQIFDKEPFPGQQGALTVTARKGKGTYIIRSNECTWVDTIFVKPGVNRGRFLMPCESGSIAFWSDDTTSSEFPITIVLNTFDKLPDLTTKFNSDVTLSTSGLNFSNRNKGTYTYSARSSTGKCVWVGRVIIESNKPTLVKLPKCN